MNRIQKTDRTTKQGTSNKRTHDYTKLPTAFRDILHQNKHRQQEAKAVAQETLDTTKEDQEAPETSRGKTIERKQVIRAELRINIPL